MFHDNFFIREIEVDDYSDYMRLMFEFTGYKYDITVDKFQQQLAEFQTMNIAKTYVMGTSIDGKRKIIGAGTLFILWKLHNNPIGQIEDVIITSEYRGTGLGKWMIEKLVTVAQEKFKVYKVILNCIEKNIDFYHKCNFNITGVQMKFSP